MKRFATICVLTAFCIGQASVRADNDKDKENKGVPPGLAKKGGLPPGQAKKQAQSESGNTVVTTPAPASVTPAVTTTAPVAAAPAGTKSTDQTASTPTKTETKQPPTFAEQKAKLGDYTHAINEATQRPTLKHIAFAQISKETGVTLDRLEQQDKNHPEIGTCALLYGNLIAKQSGAKFSDLVAHRLKGKDWAEIAKNHNVNVGTLIQKAADVSNVLKAAQSASAR
jgi:hypothetical protein